jgi:DNA-3-methyladenine glycosylase II
MAPSSDTYPDARRHLAKKDRVMKRLIDKVGPCTLQVGIDPFVVLVRSVVSQLISTAAVRTIFGRIEQAMSSSEVTARAILDLDQETLRGCGLSGTKTATIRELASKVSDGSLDLAALKEASDESVADQLLPIKGIGRWTVDMFLIFGLGRLNVLPVGDLGVRAAVRDCYKLDDLATPAQVREKGAPWQPYCTIATWYLWRSRGWVPQSNASTETT